MKKLIQDYDEENDIMYLNWGKVKESIELFEGNVVLDFGYNGKIVGIEIFDFKERLNKPNKYE